MGDDRSDDDPRVHEFLARARGAASATAQAARILSLDDLHASHGHADGDVRERWGLAALRGRLVEVSARGASAMLTCAMELVVEAQTASEPVCWVTLTGATFYPPDAAESGVDLSALVVVRADDAQIAARVAERVLRSGAFGLVVIDLACSASGSEALSMAHQGRLVTLAQAHDAAVVCLTEKPEDAASLGSLVSLRVEALRVRSPSTGGVMLRALKDKRRGPGWTRAIKVRGPDGS